MVIDDQQQAEGVHLLHVTDNILILCRSSYNCHSAVICANPHVRVSQSPVTPAKCTQMIRQGKYDDVFEL